MGSVLNRGAVLWSVTSREIASRRESRCVAMVARH